MRIVNNKKGQFILIAIMVIALMMVSIGAIMYGTGTYYRYEQWEEYITLVEHIKLNTIRSVEISLANYTAPENNCTDHRLKAILDQWQAELRKAYSGYGVILTYDLAIVSHQVYGTNISYSEGLASHWNEPVSFSAANATFTLDITSIGFKGYEFNATPFLNLTILNTTNSEINVAVAGDDQMPITELEESNFQVDGLNITDVTSSYDQKYILVYTIKCENPPLPNVTVTVTDQRGIQVIAQKT